MNKKTGMDQIEDAVIGSAVSDFINRELSKVNII